MSLAHITHVHTTKAGMEQALRWLAAEWPTFALAEIGPAAALIRDAGVAACSVDAYGQPCSHENIYLALEEWLGRTKHTCQVTS